MRYHTIVIAVSDAGDDAMIEKVVTRRLEDWTPDFVSVVEYHREKITEGDPGKSQMGGSWEVVNPDWPNGTEPHVDFVHDEDTPDEHDMDEQAQDAD